MLFTLCVISHKNNIKVNNLCFSNLSLSSLSLSLFLSSYTQHTHTPRNIHTHIYINIDWFPYWIKIKRTHKDEDHLPLVHYLMPIYCPGPRTEGKEKRKEEGEREGKEGRDGRKQEELVWIQPTRVQKKIGWKEGGLSVPKRISFYTHIYIFSKCFTTFFKLFNCS